MQAIKRAGEDLIMRAGCLLRAVLYLLVSLYLVQVVLLPFVRAKLAELQDPYRIRQIVQTLEEVAWFALTCIILMVLFILLGIIAGRSPQNKVICTSKLYKVLCWMKAEDGEEFGTPVRIYLLAYITNWGPALSPLPERYFQAKIPTVYTESYLRISAGRMDPLILSRDSLKLTYRLVHAPEFFIQAQGGEDATGDLPTDLGSAWVTFGLRFDTILDVNKDTCTCSTLPPRSLSLIALDRTWRYNMDETRALYGDIKQVLQVNDPDDDDSWMYSSRPIYW
jgi:hypothetical protein